MRASEVILVSEIKTETGFQKSSVSFLSYRKLRFHTIKMLREDALKGCLKMQAKKAGKYAEYFQNGGNHA